MMFETLIIRSMNLSRHIYGSHASSTHSVTRNHLDVEELEMLFEAYFVHIDGTLNNLSTVCKYILPNFFHAANL